MQQTFGGFNVDSERPLHKTICFESAPKGAVDGAPVESADFPAGCRIARQRVGGRDMMFLARKTLDPVLHIEWLIALPNRRQPSTPLYAEMSFHIPGFPAYGKGRIIRLAEENALSMDYAREKLYQAVHTLATSPESIQERLGWAAQFLVRLQEPGDLPEEYREEFGAVCEQLTKEQPSGDEGNIVATARKLTDEQGRKLAERIFSIYVGLRGGI